MRAYVIDKIRELFSDGRNRDVTKYTYTLDDHEYKVYSLLLNLFVLNDNQLIDFYTYLVIRCFRQR
jgi:hypothetical protein